MIGAEDHGGRCLRGKDESLPATGVPSVGRGPSRPISHCTTMAGTDPATVSLASRCGGRQVRRWEQHDLLLLAAETGLENAVRPEPVVGVVGVEAAPGPLVIDLLPCLYQIHA